MTVELDFESCDSFELLDIYRNVMDELEKRLGNHIYRANNGFVYPKTCPDCGSRLTVTRNKINLLDFEVEAIKSSAALGDTPVERWYNFIGEQIRENKFKLPCGAYSFPPVEVNGPGEWYCAWCSCKIGPWKNSYDEAVSAWWGRPLVKL